eukprot:gene13734-15799_t
MSDCNNEIEYSNVGYFDKQTVGDDKVEDPNEWLSIDIGDLVEEEAAAKQHSQNPVLPSSDSSSTCKVVTESRGFIYDTSPANSREAAQPSVACCTTPPATTTAVPAVKKQPTEPDEEELKISFMNFKAGSIALFVPVDASRKVWMAFHSNRPNRFLAQQSLDVFLNRRGKNNDKTRILARIVYIEQHVAGTGNVPAVGGAKKNDTHTASAADASDMVGNSQSSNSSSSGSKSSQPTSATRSIDSGVPSATTVPNSAVVTYESDRNPYNLPPGTVYFECFAEPITIAGAQRKSSAQEL